MKTMGAFEVVNYKNELSPFLHEKFYLRLNLDSMGCCNSFEGSIPPSNTEEMPKSYHAERHKRTRGQSAESIDSDSEAETDYSAAKRKPLISFGGQRKVAPNEDESFIEHTPTNSMGGRELQDHTPITPMRGQRSPSDAGDILQLAQYTTDHYIAVYAKQEEHDRDNSLTDHYYENDDAVYSEEMDPSDQTPEPQGTAMLRTQRSVSHALSEEEEDLILGFRLFTGLEIKDRTYKFQSVPNCFVGEECVSFMVSNNICFTRCQATERMHRLVKAGMVVHVDEDHHDFEDGLYLYCFVSPKRKFKDVDSRYGDVLRDREQAVNDRERFKLQQIQKVKDQCKKGFEVKDRKMMFKSYKQCFVGEEAVSWMVETKMATSRNEAVEIGQMFLDHKLIRHSNSDSVHFKDSDIFYEFLDDRRG